MLIHHPVKSFLAASAGLTSAFFSLNAGACEFNGAKLFHPTLARFESHPGPKQKDHAADGDYWEPVPAPVVEVTKITRRTAAVVNGESCDDAGTLALLIKLPATSTYRIEQFGVYFRLKEGQAPDQIFADVPLVGPVKDQSMSLFFAWLDPAPSEQKPLNLKVEAFLVTNGLDIGKSTIFEIKQ